MMENRSHIVAQALAHIEALFTNSVSDDYGYHNLEHTKSVLGSVEDISMSCGLKDDEVEALQLAALFHDSGYCVSHVDHEARGADMAAKYLREQNYSEDGIKNVVACINSTNIEIEPQTTLEKILCDADLSYLGKEHFSSNVAMLRAEWEITLKQVYSDAEWRQVNIDFFKKHQYYTVYAHEHFDAKKEANLNRWLEAS